MSTSVIKTLTVPFLISVLRVLPLELNLLPKRFDLGVLEPYLRLRLFVFYLLLDEQRLFLLLHLRHLSRQQTVLSVQELVVAFQVSMRPT
jgi:hypothetical protein